MRNIFTKTLLGLGIATASFIPLSHADERGYKIIPHLVSGNDLAPNDGKLYLVNDYCPIETCAKKVWVELRVHALPYPIDVNLDITRTGTFFPADAPIGTERRVVHIPANSWRWRTAIDLELDRIPESDGVVEIRIAGYRITRGVNRYYANGPRYREAPIGFAIRDDDPIFGIRAAQSTITEGERATFELYSDKQLPVGNTDNDGYGLSYRITSVGSFFSAYESGTWNVAYSTRAGQYGPPDYEQQADGTYLIETFHRNTINDIAFEADGRITVRIMEVGYAEWRQGYYHGVDRDLTGTELEITTVAVKDNDSHHFIPTVSIEGTQMETIAPNHFAITEPGDSISEERSVGFSFRATTSNFAIPGREFNVYVNIATKGDFIYQNLLTRYNPAESTWNSVNFWIYLNSDDIAESDGSISFSIANITSTSGETIPGWTWDDTTITVDIKDDDRIHIERYKYGNNTYHYADHTIREPDSCTVCTEIMSFIVESARTPADEDIEVTAEITRQGDWFPAGKTQGAETVTATIRSGQTVAVFNTGGEGSWDAHGIVWDPDELDENGSITFRITDVSKADGSAIAEATFDSEPFTVTIEDRNYYHYTIRPWWKYFVSGLKTVGGGYEITEPQALRENIPFLVIEKDSRPRGLPFKITVNVETTGDFICESCLNREFTLQGHDAGVHFWIPFTGDSVPEPDGTLIFSIASITAPDGSSLPGMTWSDEVIRITIKDDDGYVAPESEVPAQSQAAAQAYSEVADEHESDVVTQGTQDTQAQLALAFDRGTSVNVQSFVEIVGNAINQETDLSKLTNMPAFTLPLTSGTEVSGPITMWGASNSSDRLAVGQLGMDMSMQDSYVLGMTVTALESELSENISEDMSMVQSYAAYKPKNLDLRFTAIVGLGHGDLVMDGFDTFETDRTLAKVGVHSDLFDYQFGSVVGGLSLNGTAGISKHTVNETAEYLGWTTIGRDHALTVTNTNTIATEFGKFNPVIWTGFDDDLAVGGGVSHDYSGLTTSIWLNGRSMATKDDLAIDAGYGYVIDDITITPSVAFTAGHNIERRYGLNVTSGDYDIRGAVTNNNRVDINGTIRW